MSTPVCKLCEQVLLEGTLGGLISRNVDQPYKFSYLWQSPITVSGKVEARLIHCIISLISSILAKSYQSFRQGEGVADTLHNVVDFLCIGRIYHSFRQGEGMADTLHNVVDFLNKNQRSGPSCQRSSPWSRLFWFCQLLTHLQCTVKGKAYFYTTMSNNRLKPFMICSS